MPRNIEEPAPRRPPYFWWLLANALALCFAVLSWAASLHVFGNPEKPQNYKILQKLGRVPELTEYLETTAPSAPVLDPKELYKKYFGIPDDQIDKVNSLLLRNYITNFERPLQLFYISGSYRVNKIKTLDESDFIANGFVVQAQAMVKPDDFTAPAPYPVWIEYLVPTLDADAATSFGPGDLMEVQRTPNCAAVLHVAKVTQNDEPALLLTVVPIAYSSYKVGDHKKFAIKPPSSLNLGAGFPVIK